MSTAQHHPAPAPGQNPAPDPAQITVGVLEDEIIPDLRKHLSEKLRLPEGDIKKIADNLRQKVYQALGILNKGAIAEVLVKKCGERGVNLHDEKVRRKARGAVKGMLKTLKLSTYTPDEAPGLEPSTVYVRLKPRPEPSPTEKAPLSTPIPAPAPQPVQRLTESKLPVQPAPAPEIPAYDPRRSSAELPAIREKNVRDAFESAAKSMHRACQAAFPNLSDFLASAFRNPAQRELLRKKTAVRWDKWDPSRPEAEQDPAVRAELDRELEKCFREKLKTTHNLVDRKGGTEIHTKTNVRR